MRCVNHPLAEHNNASNRTHTRAHVWNAIATWGPLSHSACVRMSDSHKGTPQRMPIADWLPGRSSLLAVLIGYKKSVTLRYQVTRTVAVSDEARGVSIPKVVNTRRPNIVKSVSSVQCAINRGPRYTHQLDSIELTSGIRSANRRKLCSSACVFVIPHHKRVNTKQ